MNVRYDRRQLFRQVGPVAALLSPLLRFSRIEAASARKRFVLFHLPNGCFSSRFWPTGEGKDFDMSGKAIEALTPLKDKLLIVRGLKHPGGGHEQIGGLFTNRKLLSNNGVDGESIDWFLARHIQASAQKTPVHSLQLGVDCPQPASRNCAQTRDETGSLRALENDPAKVFDRVFKPLTLGCTASPMQVASKEDIRRKSILDALRADVASAKRALALGPEEMRKLDQHETSLRAIEEQIASLKDRVQQSCGSAADELKRLGQNVADTAMAMRGRLHADLTTLAFELDLTAVVSISHFYEGGNAGKQLDLHWFKEKDGRYAADGDQVKVFHHRLSHRSNGEEPNVERKLLAVDKWAFENLAYLAGKMNASATSSGSMLDNACILYMSTIGDGKTHSTSNIPCIVVGGAGGRLPVGQYIPSAGANHGRVLTSICHAFGHNIPEFGNKGASTALFS